LLGGDTGGSVEVHPVSVAMKNATMLGVRTLERKSLMAVG
jgi:hypothetical protein